MSWLGECARSITSTVRSKTTTGFASTNIDPKPTRIEVVGMYSRGEESKKTRRTNHKIAALNGGSIDLLVSEKHQPESLSGPSSALSFFPDMP